ncbi:sel1 repeat family protein [Paraglaciecola aquimarina]|uniref:Sel1 repeat family protein n=1 Tax=Paraglaciecola algarum TaxID=3050085 RepID=A0ABS9D813_9ALTE|nr:sel1 repeat family protein [Paraglaciecola sp. G1-23]MCF2948844.1 sel1 repeat family protein [Paraglaciecola sp. G1-23]
MKNMRKNLIAVLAIALPFQAASLNLLKANDDFKDKQYDLAFQEYKQGAQVGNSHAYYQLGVMYSKGLGVEPDLVNSILYFSLAAEQNYSQANEILDLMLSNLDTNQLTEVHALLDEFKQNQDVFTQQFMPEIIEENLAHKVTFDGKPELEKKFFIDLDEEELGISPYGGSGNSVGEGGVESFGGIIISKPALLIVETDVASDGSKRNIQKLQKHGLTRGYLDKYKLFPTAKPQFKGKPVDFVTRSYMGVAADDAFAFVDQQPRLYGDIRKIVRAAEKSDTLEEKYQHAIAMTMFPWLEKQPNQAENLMKNLALRGHPAAMYEYGFMLYTKQKDIPEAVKWITEASKYGLARAEYRLGKLLTSSPWVQSDEKKALFWFESAMEKGHDAATLYAAKIKLTSQDPTLKDVAGAIEYLALAEKPQRLNPEYFHLLALSYKDRPARDFKLVIDNLERAIWMGNQANWDTSEWQDLLSQFTTGKVTIADS